MLDAVIYYWQKTAELTTGIFDSNYIQTAHPAAEVYVHRKTNQTTLAAEVRHIYGMLQPPVYEIWDMGYGIWGKNKEPRRGLYRVGEQSQGIPTSCWGSRLMFNDT